MSDTALVSDRLVPQQQSPDESRLQVRSPKTRDEFLSAYKELIQTTKPEPTETHLQSVADGLAQFVALLQTWNRRTQLVSHDSLGEVWSRHIWDSAQLAAFLPARAHQAVSPSQAPLVLVDLGSGAGFPGLVLAGLLAGLEVHLLEANAKKAAFLREAAHCLRSTVATRLRVHATRSETWQGTTQGADFVTARAVAPLPRLVALAAPHLAPDGQCLFHQGAGQARALARNAQDAVPKGWEFASHPSRSALGAAILVLQRREKAPTEKRTKKHTKKTH